MKKIIIASSIALVLCTTSVNMAHASNNTDESKDRAKNELVGFGSGAALGAAFGGPIGAAVGGIFGILIANDVNDDIKLTRTNNALAQSQHNLEQERANLIAMQKDYEAMQQQQLSQLVSFEQQASENWLEDFSQFETNLQFKTASFSIENAYHQQLDNLAQMLVEYPSLSIKLTGFADLRGDSAYNQNLSQQRATEVQKYLIDKQVKSSQIRVVALGEAPTLLLSDATIADDTISAASTNALTLEQGSTQTTDLAKHSYDHEDLFFARRVNIKIFNNNKQLTASNQKP